MTEMLIVIGLAVVLIVLPGCQGKSSKEDNGTQNDNSSEKATLKRSDDKDDSSTESASPEEQLETVSFYDDGKKDRYAAYWKDNPNESAEEVVSYVNTDADEPLPDDPEEISMPTTVLTIANKRHALPADYEPKDMVRVPQPCSENDFSCYLGDQFIQEVAYQPLNDWTDAVEAELGHTLKTIAAYRSYSYQQSVFDYALTSMSEEEARKVIAMPGLSEHQLGLAVDVTVDGVRYDELESISDYKVLLEIAAQYGFILRYPADKTAITGYDHESWHFRYVGAEAAQTIYQNNWTLEEYVGRGNRS